MNKETNFARKETLILWRKNEIRRNIYVKCKSIIDNTK